MPVRTHAPQPPRGTRYDSLASLPYVLTGWGGWYVLTLAWNVVVHVSAAVAAGGAAWAVAAAVRGAAPQQLWWPTVVVLAATLLRSVSLWQESYTSHDLSFRVMARIRVWVFDALARVAPGGLADRRRGDLASAAMNDAEALEVFLAHSSLYRFGRFLATPVVLVLLACLDPVVAAVTVPFLLLLLLVPVLTRRAALREGAVARRTLAALAAEMQEDAGCVREIVAFGLEGTRRARLERLQAELSRAQLRTVLRTGVEGAVAGVATALLAVAATAVGALQVQAGRLDLGLLPTTVAVAAATPSAILQWISTSRHTGNTAAAARRIEEILDAEPPLPVLPGGVVGKGDPVGPSAAEHAGADPGRASATGAAGADPSDVEDGGDHRARPVGGGVGRTGAGVGPVGVGPVGVGPVGVGSVGVGSVGVGSVGVGSVGTAGLGGTGVGTAGAGLGGAGVGSAGVAGVGVGSAGADGVVGCADVAGARDGRRGRPERSADRPRGAAPGPGPAVPDPAGVAGSGAGPGGGAAPLVVAGAACPAADAPGGGTPERAGPVAAALPVRLRAAGATGAPRPAAVEVRDVRFTWPGAPQPAVAEVSLRIDAGEQVAIAGRSGSGKSTLAKLLARWYDPDAGVIRLDGLDLRTVPLERLRRQVRLVPQDPHLFAESVRENLLLAWTDDGDEPDDDALWRALEQAGATDAVRRLPRGLDTVLADHGASLSGGERQRIALARVFLHPSRVVVLDESVSQLDTGAAASVQRALAGEGRTTVVIAHRLVTLLQAQRIILMSEGRVVGDGTHVELLGTHPGYRALVEPQLAT